MVRYVVPFTIGLGASLGVHQFTGWWLNSSRGVASMLLVLAVISMFVSWLGRDPSTKPATALWAGTFAGMVGILVWTGAGTIWPIVMVVAGVLSACAIAVGAVAGHAFGSRKPAAR